MNEIRTLNGKILDLHGYSDKETFYKVKRDIPNFQTFYQRTAGMEADTYREAV